MLSGKRLKTEESGEAGVTAEEPSAPPPDSVLALPFLEDEANADSLRIILQKTMAIDATKLGLGGQCDYKAIVKLATVSKLWCKMIDSVVHASSLVDPTEVRSLKMGDVT